MSAATAGILGALAGLGLVLVVAGLRRAAAPEPSPRLAQLAARVQIGRASCRERVLACV